MQFRFPFLFAVWFAIAFHAPAAFSAETLAFNSLETVQDWRSTLPPARSPSAQAVVQVKNSRLALSNKVHFDVEALQGELSPVDAGSLISLDSLDTFKVQVQHAQLRISDAVLQTLVQSELEASDAPLRIKHVKVTPTGVEIAGDIRRLGLWIPFEMKGTPQVGNSREITLTPSSLKVAGVPVYRALLSTNIQLQSLIDMKSKAVALQGQAMVLRLDQLLKTPRISFALNALQLGQGEVQVVLGNPPQPAFFCGALCPTNFVYSQGGKLHAAGMALSGQPTLLTGVAGRALPLALHELDLLVRTSTIQLRTDGAIWISAQEGLLDEGETSLLAAGARTMNRLAGLLEKSAGPQAPQALTMAVHQATLRSREGVELHVEKLLASTQSTDLDQLPTAEQTVHTGEIALGEKALDSLLNQSLFNYPGSPIREVKSTIGMPLIELALQVKPEILGIPLVWLPVQLRGEMNIATDRMHLEFTPTEARIFGMSVLPVIEFLGFQLDSLIEINQPAIKLSGNTILIVLNNALAPLQVNTRLLSLTTTTSPTLGAVLQLKVGLQTAQTSAGIENEMELLPRGLWLNTPEFTALGLRTGPTLAHIYKAQRTERLVIDLARYPALLSDATIRLPVKERVWISMPGLPQAGSTQ